jgi:hypothetical protein
LRSIVPSAFSLVGAAGGFGEEIGAGAGTETGIGFVEFKLVMAANLLSAALVCLGLLSPSTPNGPFSRTVLNCGTIGFMTMLATASGLLIVVEMDGSAAMLLDGTGEVPRLLVGLMYSRLRVLV